MRAKNRARIGGAGAVVVSFLRFKVVGNFFESLKGKRTGAKGREKKLHGVNHK